MSILKKIRFEVVLFLLITAYTFISFDLDIGIKNLFERINYSPVISTSSLYGNIYLEKFFINITELGNSVWYFSFIIFSLTILYTNKKLNLYEIKNHNEKINLFISAFIYLFANGLVTQIFKHIIGRPRPNHTNFEDDVTFNFFTFESEFHSFPSGHSSTIFMICLILCRMMPKIKYFLFLFAFIIALSRVVVNAHFFTDIVAGMILAFMVFKFLDIFFDKYYKKFLLSEIDLLKNSLIFNFFMVLFIACVFLTVGPSLDIYISGLFLRGTPQFLLQRFDFFSVLFRDILLPLILIYILVLPILCRYLKIEKIYFGYKFSFKEFVGIWLSQILAVGVIVNFILKGLWGRARPEDVIQYGGSQIFTPWFHFSDACMNNCSFVSGDAAVGFSFIALYFVTKNKMFFYLSITAGCSMGLIRILAGAHFLSDIIFSGLVLLIINFIFFKIYKKFYE